MIDFRGKWDTLSIHDDHKLFKKDSYNGQQNSPMIVANSCLSLREHGVYSSWFGKPHIMYIDVPMYILCVRMVQSAEK